MSEIITAPWAAAGVSAYSLNRLTGHAENPARRFEFDQLIDVAAPRWLLQVDWQRLDMATTGQVEAFLSRLAAGARFTSPPPLRRRPLAFHTGTTRGWLANPATEASVHAITAGTSTLEVAGLTVGAVISPGDFCSYVGTGFTGPDLYNVADTAPVTVGANGRAILRVWPRPAPAVAGTAVRFDGAAGTFRASQDAISQALSIGPGPQPGTLRLQALSVAG
jgi:hypothetical protein